MTKANKQRLDQLLVERGLAESRARAQAMIMAGLVSSDTRRLDKPGHRVAVDIPLAVKGPEHPWVSRGGVKLAHGLGHFRIEAKSKVCLDIGASTGGFTDVLLNAGAAKVYAVDVGHGQLDWKISQDERVQVLDKTNARYLTTEQVPDPVDLIVCDASFIGLEVVLGNPMSLAVAGAHLVALIKPQFEVGRGKVGKGGIVRDPAQHREVCRRIENWINGQKTDEHGWRVSGITESPLTGADGNKEFLIAAVLEG